MTPYRAHSVLVTETAAVAHPDRPTAIRHYAITTAPVADDPHAPSQTFLTHDRDQFDEALTLEASGARIDVCWHYATLSNGRTCRVLDRFEEATTWVTDRPS